MTLIGILETFGTAAAFEELSHTWAWYGASQDMSVVGSCGRTVHTSSHIHRMLLNTIKLHCRFKSRSSQFGNKKQKAVEILKI